MHDQNFYWGGGGGGSSEGCLKWGSGGWGSLWDLSKNILKQGWVKAKVVRGGVEGVTTHAPPENFNHTLARVVFVEALNECVMYVSCMYHECIRNVS